MLGRVLVVDDEETAREELCEALRDAGYAVDSAGDAESALPRLQGASYDVCISDIRLPGSDGIALLREVKTQSPETSVLLITAYGELVTALEAMRSGAADYLLKPILFCEIVRKVAAVIEQRRLAVEVATLRRRLAGCVGSHRLVGDGPAMQAVKDLIAKVGRTGCNVLITGESGTGKELIAETIHASGDHARSPFVPVNCGAISPGLLESELFGHVKGAFTGAVDSKEGLFAAAGDGTIFLDEIGDMPIELQVKLLRVVDSREIQPVGSVRRVPTRARVVAATNKDLAAEVAAGRFREDLFYRLSVVEICCPPLRERREDIPLLVEHLVAKLNGELRRSFAGVDRRAMQMLVGHCWKGNVRELANVLERAMIVSAGDQLILPEDLPQVLREPVGLVPEACVDLREATRRFELAHIDRVVAQCGGDKREAARLLGIGLSSLYRKHTENGSERPVGQASHG